MSKLRVLVIDDEELVRDVLARLLVRLGAVVTSERDGDSGVARYAEARAAGDAFDVVLLDLTLTGGMGGEQTLRALLRIDPACRAIVCSGYSNDPVLLDYRAHGFVARVTKPFRLEELRRALREAMGEESEEAGAEGMA